MRPARSSAPRSCSRPMPGCRTRPLPRACAWAARPSTGPGAASWKAISTRRCAEEPRPGAKRKLTGHEEALLVATACSRPPEGRARWTIELLAGEMVRLTDHGSLSGETVRRRLAKNKLKPWREKMWCVPKIDGEYVARMEDVLDLYAEPPDPARPVVCLDESPVQLIGEVREPIPASPGQIARVDYEYRRNGTVNLFVPMRPPSRGTSASRRLIRRSSRIAPALVECRGTGTHRRASWPGFRGRAATPAPRPPLRPSRTPREAAHRWPHRHRSQSEEPPGSRLPVDQCAVAVECQDTRVREL